jgi:LacI family transcriptional regulator
LTQSHRRAVTKKKSISPATLNDVARAADVSLATAARVLRGDDYPVAAGRKERVLKAAQKLHYVPNLLARVLKGGSHRSIGLVVGDMSDPYFGEIAQAVSVSAQSRSLVAIVANMHRDPQLEIMMCRELWAHRVNGVILAGGGFDQVTHNDQLSDLVRRMQRMNIAVVSLTERNLPTPCFSADDEEAGRMAAAHLLANGHSEVGMIMGPATSEVTRRRLKGSGAAFAVAGVLPKVVHTDFGDTAGEDALAALLGSGPRITAIISSGDNVGVGILDHLRGMGRRVPEDISVLSIGNTYFGRLSYPKLTAIDLHLSQCSVAAVNHIADTLDGKAPPHPNLTAVSLVPGQSMRDLRRQPAVPRIARRSRAAR